MGKRIERYIYLSIMYVCMKMNRTYSLDVELVEHLSKEHNSSMLINSLLREHYSSSRENIEKRKAEIEAELKGISIIEEDIAIVENETEKQALLRAKKEAIVAKKRVQFNEEKDKLTLSCKKKEITFPEYREACAKLKEKWGIR